MARVTTCSFREVGAFNDTRTGVDIPLARMVKAIPDAGGHRHR